MTSPALAGPDLRYPIGRFRRPETLQGLERRAAIAAIAALPDELTVAVYGLSELRLDTPYREGGWTVRQLVHHVADSHMNAFLRIRLALTEDWPTIKPYHEAKWAELVDGRTLPIEVSLNLLRALHQRWVALLASLSDVDWQRGYVHPEMGKQPLDSVLALYVWHGRHHTAHVTELRKRENW